MLSRHVYTLFTYKCVPRINVFIKRMFISVVACTPTSRALNKSSPGAVRFFIDRLYANFSSMKITSPTRINTKTRK